jgi:hypothetical protein
MRFSSRSIFVGFGFLAAGLLSCNRAETPAVTTTDSVTTSVTVKPAAPATDSGATPMQPTPAPATATPRASGDTLQPRILSGDDPIAKRMLEAMRGRPPGYKPQEGPVLPHNVIPSSRLADLQPKIPGYELVDQPSNFDGQGQGRSTALLRSTEDPSKTIRAIIKSEDETLNSSFAQKVNELRQAGSLTDYTQGEPITAYYLQVGGMPAAKAYIPSKHVATLTVFVGEHRIIQLREDKVNSADHLVEVSRYLDVKRLAGMKPQP